jgi:pimeloyl-ACP methyl ester carboxylesterase
LVPFSLDIGALQLSRTWQGPCRRAAQTAPVQRDTQATELVEVRTADRLPLTGLFAAAGPAASSPRFDAALLMHGAASSFDEGLLGDFSAALGSRGLATLRAGNRGHDVVNWGDGRGRLLGTAFERIDECVLDWRAWLDLLEARGFRRVLLFGHSLGAVKCAFYLAQESDARVAGCVLASPPRFNTERMLACERGDELAATLTAAQAEVAAGRPDAIVRTTFPLASISGARAYIAKYAAGARYDIFANVPAIACPVLALTGERELGDALFRDHPGDYEDARERKPDIEHVVVPGGDHHYRRVRDVAIASLLAWIDAG